MLPYLRWLDYCKASVLVSERAATERAPVRTNYRGYEVISMGPPSSGGVAMIQMLNMLSRFDLKPLGFGSSTYIHLLTEVMRRAYADRGRWLGDPDFYEAPVEGLISRSYADKRGAGIDFDRMSDVGPGVPPGAKESDDTTHFSIIDKDGNESDVGPSCVSPNYHFDEAPTGNRCSNDCHCTNTRTCSEWGWCQYNQDVATSCTHPSYVFDEAPTGNRCSNDCQCDGTRSCSSWNWC